jgi:hypothetical protein
MAGLRKAFCHRDRPELAGKRLIASRFGTFSTKTREASVKVAC